MKPLWKQRIRYLTGKMMTMVILLILLSIIVFVIARLAPGDPLRSYYGDSVEHMNTEEKVAAMERLGLNDPMVVQYARWAEKVFDGDMGLSYKYKQPVSQVIAGFAGNTLILGGLTYVLTFGLSILLGMFCAVRENHLIDRIICKIGVISGTIPSFFIALILILIFAVNLGIFPTGGAYSIGGSHHFFDRMYHLVLPVTVLVIEHLWYYAYMIRNKLLVETRQDYVLLCKAEGMSNWRIISRQCLTNILPSIFVMMAISLPHILGGTYVVEMVFSYPGLGTLSFESARYQDYNMLMALTIMTGMVVLLFNMLAQIFSETIDPRMKHEQRAVGE